MKLKLNKVRIAFPKLFNAEQVNGEGKAAFSAAFLFPKDHPQVGEIGAAMKSVATEKWGAKADEILKALRAGDKTCVHNGDAKADTEGYAGNYFINARNAVRPLVLHKDKSVLAESDGVVYGGCYVNASLELWAQDNKFGKRINATLTGVQFHSGGDAFVAGATASPDDFDDLSDQGEAASAPADTGALA